MRTWEELKKEISALSPEEMKEIKERAKRDLENGLTFEQGLESMFKEMKK